MYATNEAYYGFDARPSPLSEYHGEEEVYRMGYLINSLPAEYMDIQANYAPTEQYPLYGADISPTLCHYPEQQSPIVSPHVSYPPLPFDAIPVGVQYPQAKFHQPDHSLPTEHMGTQVDYSSIATTHLPLHEPGYIASIHVPYPPHPFDDIFEGIQYPQMDDFYASSSSPGSSEGTVSSPATSVTSIIPDPQNVEELHSYIFNPTVEATIITEQMARIKIRNKIRHVCKICHKVYSNCSNLRNHIHTKHYGNQVPWECVTCNKRFSSQTSARRHKKAWEPPERPARTAIKPFLDRIT